MQPNKCPNCHKEGADRVPSTMERRDQTGRIYQIPCYFCVSCMHEEEVPLDQLSTWGAAYWATLPTSVRPPEKSIRSKASAPGFPDYTL